MMYPKLQDANCNCCLPNQVEYLETKIQQCSVFPWSLCLSRRTSGEMMGTLRPWSTPVQTLAGLHVAVSVTSRLPTRLWPAPLARSLARYPEPLRLQG